MSARTTIGQMFVFERNCIYVVSGRINGEYKPYIYIGSTEVDNNSVAGRITQHLNGNERGMQRFGELLVEHRNATLESRPSYRWKVKTLTKKECCDHLRLTRRQRVGLTLRNVETMMIQQYEPIANTNHLRRRRTLR